MSLAVDVASLLASMKLIQATCSAHCIHIVMTNKLQAVSLMCFKSERLIQLEGWILIEPYGICVFAPPPPDMMIADKRAASPAAGHHNMN